MDTLKWSENTFSNGPIGREENVFLKAPELNGIFLIGGYDDVTWPSQYLNDVWFLDLANLQWYLINTPTDMRDRVDFSFYFDSSENIIFLLGGASSYNTLFHGDGLLIQE